MTSLIDVLGIGAAVVTIGAGGVGVGRWTSHEYVGRKKEREAKAEEEEHKRQEELEMRYAILGRPKSDWQPASKGLREVVADMGETMSAHRKEDASLFDDQRKLIQTVADQLANHLTQPHEGDGS